jgi:SAM-dependent methyltransferase
MTTGWRDCALCGRPGPALLFRKDGFDLVRCAGCGLVQVGQDPAAIDFQSLYGESYYNGGSDQVFANYIGQQTARRAQARRKLWALRHLPPRVARCGRLLDVGCAAGFFLAEARRFYTVQGVELSAFSSAFARERLGLPVHTGTLQTAALPGAHYHIVTLWDVIEHVADPVAVLSEAARVLRPGGRLILTTGDWGSAYAQARGADWHLATPPWHLTLFSRDTLVQAAACAGLRLVAARSQGVAGDGPLWRNRVSLLLSRLAGLGDIVQMSFARSAG